MKFKILFWISALVNILLLVGLCALAVEHIKGRARVAVLAGQLEREHQTYLDDRDVVAERDEIVQRFEGLNSKTTPDPSTCRIYDEVKRLRVQLLGLLPDRSTDTAQPVLREMQVCMDVINRLEVGMSYDAVEKILKEHGLSFGGLVGNNTMLTNMIRVPNPISFVIDTRLPDNHKRDPHTSTVVGWRLRDADGRYVPDYTHPLEAWSRLQGGRDNRPRPQKYPLSLDELFTFELDPGEQLEKSDLILMHTQYEIFMTIPFLRLFDRNGHVDYKPKDSYGMRWEHHQVHGEKLVAVLNNSPEGGSNECIVILVNKRGVAEVYTVIKKDYLEVIKGSELVGDTIIIHAMNDNPSEYKIEVGGSRLSYKIDVLNGFNEVP